MQNLFSILRDNLIFFIEFMLTVAGLFLAAYSTEKLHNKAVGYKGRILTTKKLTVIGLFSAIATIIMMFEVPLPFAPTFYKIDLSELPVLIVSFAYGPVAGVLTEFCKILLKLVFRSTSTAFVGELANFVVGVSFILPASIIYLFKKTKTSAVFGTLSGTVIMTVFGSAFNLIYLLPKFASMYGMPLEAIVNMGTAINPYINSVYTLVLFSVVPLNLIKGSVVSVLTLSLYKKISVILKVEDFAASKIKKLESSVV